MNFLSNFYEAAHRILFSGFFPVLKTRAEKRRKKKLEKELKNSNPG